VALKPEYGPTLAQLAAPRWRRASSRTRWIAALLAVAAVAAILAIILALRSATITHGGHVPFSFAYKGLSKSAPEAGGYVRVQQVSAGGLEDSFAVAPLRLPPYSGSVTGEYPQYASSYIRSLSTRFQHFELVGQGPVRTSAFGSWEELPPSTIYYHVPTYTIAFKATVGGRTVYGREIWLVPNKKGAREGVDIRMLAAASASGHAASPMSVGTAGVLSRPMRTFSLGA
jgi:hypothetical protein